MGGKRAQKKKDKEQIKEGVKVILPFDMPKILCKV